MKRVSASLVFMLLVLATAGGLWWWRHDDSLVYDPYTGFTDDPSVYMVVGKALSEGRGYRLINQPQRAHYRLAPIGYPLVVAAVLRVMQPDDVIRAVIPIKFTCLLFFAGALALFSVWWRRQEGAARGLWWWGLPLVAASPLLLTHASAVMSEVPYLCLLLAGLLVVEHVLARAEGRGGAMRLGEILQVALALTAPFYVRTIGASWIAAGLVFLAARRRLGDATRVLNWVLVFLAPWMLIMFAGYGRRSQAILAVALLAAALGMVPERRARAAPAIGAVVAGVTFCFLFFVPGGPGGTYVGQAVAEQPTIRRVLEHFVLFVISVGAAIADGGPIPLGLNQYGPGALHLAFGWADGTLLALTIVVALGWMRRVKEKLGLVEIYLILYPLMVLATPWVELRYVAPILPFVILYLLTGVRLLARGLMHYVPSLRSQRWETAAVTACTLLLAGLALASNFTGAKWVQTSVEQRDMDVGAPGYWRAIAWIRDHTREESVVTGRYQGIIFLYGHRQSVRYLQSPKETVAQDILERGVTIAIEDRLIKGGYNFTAMYLAPALDLLRRQGFAEVIHELPGASGARIWRIDASSQASLGAGAGPVAHDTEALPASAQAARH